MRFTINTFRRLYPDNDACLDKIFKDRFGDLENCPKCGKKTHFYKVSKRQCYACQYCAHQLHPLADTIFRKSSTPLWNWFYAIQLFSVSKNGVSAAELQRILGCTYKTAWRMCKQIRLLMQEDDGKPLKGIVEVDEAYIGPKGDNWNKHETKQIVIAGIERGGRVKAQGIDRINKANSLPFLKGNINSKAKLYTDSHVTYTKVKHEFDHEFVNHSHKEWARGNVHINTIEGFWSYVKRSISGTYVGVSKKYALSYINQFVWLYNHRAVGPALLDRASQPV